MFLVSDTPDQRARLVRSFLPKHPSVALIVAAVYFEWTVSRAIIALSSRPNVSVRRSLACMYGLEKYKDLWRAEQPDLVKCRLLPQIVRNWSGVTDAFHERDRLVHGRNRHTRNMATPHVEALLAAVSDVFEYCRGFGADIGKRLPVRRGRNQAPATTDLVAVKSAGATQ